VWSAGAELNAAERAELFALLAEDSDELVREKAGQAVQKQSPEAFAEALQGDSPSVQLFRYCGRHLIEQPAIAAALIKHRRCPPEFLIAASRSVPTEAVQEILDDLDRLSANPTLAAALLLATSLTPDQRQQLQDLQKDTFETEETFAEAVQTAEADPTKRVTLLQRLSKMRVAERVQAALKGSREERTALIRDPCKVVQRAVLQSARITDREVETFASMAILSDEILRLIATHRNFRRNYTVVKNLVNNPKTPLDISLGLLKQLKVNDLKTLTLNRNIPDVLRNSSVRLNRQRNEKRD
jgi:hypothetical protein